MTFNVQNPWDPRGESRCGGPAGSLARDTPALGGWDPERWDAHDCPDCRYVTARYIPFILEDGKLLAWQGINRNTSF